MNKNNQSRTASFERTTKETTVNVTLTLDGSGVIDVVTGIGFLDHLIAAMAFHAGFDLTLKATGDLDVDDHHTAEDCAICLGSALADALGDRSGIVRFGCAYAPLDEALARAVIDISNRPGAFVNVDLRREMIGSLASENVAHFFRSLAVNGRFTLHLDVLRGENDHHRAEAAAKAAALALRQAVSLRPGPTAPSTKGVL